MIVSGAIIDPKTGMTLNPDDKGYEEALESLRSQDAFSSMVSRDTGWSSIVSSLQQALPEADYTPKYLSSVQYGPVLKAPEAPTLSDIPQIPSTGGTPIAPSGGLSEYNWWQQQAASIGVNPRGLKMDELKREVKLAQGRLPQSSTKVGPGMEDVPTGHYASMQAELPTPEASAPFMEAMSYGFARSEVAGVVGGGSVQQQEARLKGAFQSVYGTRPAGYSGTEWRYMQEGARTRRRGEFAWTEEDKEAFGGFPRSYQWKEAEEYMSQQLGRPVGPMFARQGGSSFYPISSLTQGTFWLQGSKPGSIITPLAESKLEKRAQLTAARKRVDVYGYDEQGGVVPMNVRASMKSGPLSETPEIGVMLKTAIPLSEVLPSGQGMIKQGTIESVRRRKSVNIDLPEDYDVQGLATPGTTWTAGEGGIELFKGATPLELRTGKWQTAELMDVQRTETGLTATLEYATSPARAFLEQKTGAPKLYSAMGDVEALTGRSDIQAIAPAKDYLGAAWQYVMGQDREGIQQMLRQGGYSGPMPESFSEAGRELVKAFSEHVLPQITEDVTYKRKVHRTALQDYEGMDYTKKSLGKGMYEVSVTVPSIVGDMFTPLGREYPYRMPRWSVRDLQRIKRVNPQLHQQLVREGAPIKQSYQSVMGAALASRGVAEAPDAVDLSRESLLKMSQQAVMAAGADAPADVMWGHIMEAAGKEFGSKAVHVGEGRYLAAPGSIQRLLASGALEGSEATSLGRNMAKAYQALTVGPEMPTEEREMAIRQALESQEELAFGRNMQQKLMSAYMPERAFGVAGTASQGLPSNLAVAQEDLVLRAYGIKPGTQRATEFLSSWKEGRISPEAIVTRQPLSTDDPFKGSLGVIHPEVAKERYGVLLDKDTPLVMSQRYVGSTGGDTDMDKFLAMMLGNVTGRGGEMRIKDKMGVKRFTQKQIAQMEKQAVARGAASLSDEFGSSVGETDGTLEGVQDYLNVSNWKEYSPRELQAAMQGTLGLKEKIGGAYNVLEQVGIRGAAMGEGRLAASEDLFGTVYGIMQRPAELPEGLEKLRAMMLTYNPGTGGYYSEDSPQSVGSSGLSGLQSAITSEIAGLTLEGAMGEGKGPALTAQAAAGLISPAGKSGEVQSLIEQYAGARGETEQRAIVDKITAAVGDLPGFVESPLGRVASAQAYGKALKKGQGEGGAAEAARVWLAQTKTKEFEQTFPGVMESVREQFDYQQTYRKAMEKYAVDDPTTRGIERAQAAARVFPEEMEGIKMIPGAKPRDLGFDKYGRKHLRPEDLMIRDEAPPPGYESPQPKEDDIHMMRAVEKIEAEGLPPDAEQAALEQLGMNPPSPPARKSPAPPPPPHEADMGPPAAGGQAPPPPEEPPVAVAAPEPDEDIPRGTEPKIDPQKTGQMARQQQNIDAIRQYYVGETGFTGTRQQVEQHLEEQGYAPTTGGARRAGVTPVRASRSVEFNRPPQPDAPPPTEAPQQTGMSKHDVVDAMFHAMSRSRKTPEDVTDEHLETLSALNQRLKKWHETVGGAIESGEELNKGQIRLTQSLVKQMRPMEGIQQAAMAGGDDPLAARARAMLGDITGSQQYQVLGAAGEQIDQQQWGDLVAEAGGGQGGWRGSLSRVAGGLGKGVNRMLSGFGLFYLSRMMGLSTGLASRGMAAYSQQQTNVQQALWQGGAQQWYQPEMLQWMKGQQGMQFGMEDLGRRTMATWSDEYEALGGLMGGSGNLSGLMANALAPAGGLGMAAYYFTKSKLAGGVVGGVSALVGTANYAAGQAKLDQRLANRVLDGTDRDIISRIGQTISSPSTDEIKDFMERYGVQGTVPQGASDADIFSMMLAGAGSGAMTGGVAGSTVLPGIGTGLGALIGGGLGGILGIWSGMNQPKSEQMGGLLDLAEGYAEDLINAGGSGFMNAAPGIRALALTKMQTGIQQGAMVSGEAAGSATGQMLAMFGEVPGAYVGGKFRPSDQMIRFTQGVSMGEDYMSRMQMKAAREGTAWWNMELQDREVERYKEPVKRIKEESSRFGVLRWLGLDEITTPTEGYSPELEDVMSKRGAEAKAWEAFTQMVTPLEKIARLAPKASEGMDQFIERLETIHETSPEVAQAAASLEEQMAQARAMGLDVGQVELSTRTSRGRRRTATAADIYEQRMDYESQIAPIMSARSTLMGMGVGWRKAAAAANVFMDRPTDAMTFERLLSGDSSILNKVGKQNLGGIRVGGVDFSAQFANTQETWMQALEQVIGPENTETIRGMMGNIRPLTESTGMKMGTTQMYSDFYQRWQTAGGRVPTGAGGKVLVGLDDESLQKMAELAVEGGTRGLNTRARGLQMEYQEFQWSQAERRRGWQEVSQFGGEFEGFSTRGTFAIQKELRNLGRMWEEYMQEYQDKSRQLRYRQYMENWSVRAERMPIKFQWQREDLAMQGARTALQHGWQMEDYEEQIRYATGRQRRQLERRRERSVISYAMSMNQLDTRGQRLDQREQWAEEDLERERRHFEERFALQDEYQEKYRSYWEQRRELQDELQRIREFGARLQLDMAEENAEKQEELEKQLRAINQIQEAISQELENAAGQQQKLVSTMTWLIQQFGPEGSMAKHAEATIAHIENELVDLGRVASLSLNGYRNRR